MSETTMFWVAVTGLAFSACGSVIGVLSLALTWFARRQVNRFAVMGLTLGLISTPLNLYHTLRLWP